MFIYSLGEETQALRQGDESDHTEHEQPCLKSNRKHPWLISRIKESKERKKKWNFSYAAEIEEVGDNGKRYEGKQKEEFRSQKNLLKIGQYVS